MEDDLALLDRWRSGDAEAGNVLFARYFEEIYRFFEHKADGDLDDLVQEVFFACVRSRETFRRHSSFRTFLFAIARHTLFAYWRRKKHTPRTLDFDEISVVSLSTSVGTRLAKRQEHSAVLNALQMLPLDQQMLLEMFYWSEFDRAQLAEVFEVAEATIGSRLFRARKALQDQLTGVNIDQVDELARSARGE